MIKRCTKLFLALGVRTWDLLIERARRWTGRPPRSRGVVLYYHAVQPEQAGRFAAQMDWLMRVATPWRAESPIQRSPGLHVAITFDDGYLSVVENALPVLKQRNLPFTMFFPTGSWGSRPGWVHRPDHPFWQERILTKDELCTLAQEPLLTIGSHSVTHPKFPALDRAAAAREFSESKNELESLLERPVDLFCFPHGACNEALIQLAADAGYRRVFTVAPHVIDPARPTLALGRIAVEPDDSPLEFRLKMTGAYRWQTWLSRRSRNAQ